MVAKIAFHTFLNIFLNPTNFFRDVMYPYLTLSLYSFRQFIDCCDDVHDERMQKYSCISIYLSRETWEMVAKVAFHTSLNTFFKTTNTVSYNVSLPDIAFALFRTVHRL